MGTFLAVTAFRDLTADQLTERIVQAAQGLGLTPETLPAGDPDLDTQAAIYPARNGWTVVRWPEEFHLHDISAAALLTSPHGTASTVHLYDDDYWTHAAVRDGTVLDVYCSIPDYFDDDPDLTERYAGQPDTVAATLSLKLDDAARLLRPAADTDGDPWAFTELWDAAGIHYPDPSDDEPASLVDLGTDWPHAFPANPSDL